MAKRVKTEEITEKEQQRATLKEKLEKDYGKGSIVGANETISNIEVISTGSLNLNRALGAGGYPRGRIIEIQGQESCGKTTLCLEAIAQVHKNDPTALAAIVDAEYALSMDYIEALNIDLNRLEISQPDNGEQAIDIVRDLVDSGLYDIIVVDSVAALTPKAEIDGDIDETKMGLHARLMSKSMRVLVASVSRSKTCLIFTNQLRDKIGNMGYGDPSVGTGGNSLKFYASVRLKISRTGSEKNGEEAVANTTKVKVIKNKVGSPFKIATFSIRFGEGIDKLGELIDIASDLDIIAKSGSWYSYNDDKIGQGKDAVKELLKENSNLREEIEQKVMENLDNLELKEEKEEV